jgi:hypothetical protein
MSKIQIYFLRIVFLFCIYSSCFASDMDQKIRTHFFSPDITCLPISNWEEPTIEDYWLIQRFFKQKLNAIIDSPISARPFPNDLLNTEFHGWLTYRMGRLFLIQDGEQPSFNVIYCNNDPNKKDRCVICYVGYPSGGSLDREYVRGIHHIAASLQKFGFDGHFIYRVGGWPSLKKGRLKFADVPFAFKPFLFEEVRDLGYKNILWLDASCVPVKSLNPIFDFIERQGLCFHSYDSMLGWREFAKGYKYLISFLDISEQKRYEEISSQIIGINVDHSGGSNLLNQWIEAAERKIPFLQSDEPPFSFLVNHLNLLYGRLPSDSYVETPCNTGDFSYWRKNPRAIIYHQYDFISHYMNVPTDIFDH